MTTDHRKPAVAFVALAFAAAALVGVQQADALGGRFLAGTVGSDVHARGEIAAASGARSSEQTPLGQAIVEFSRLSAQSTSPSRTAVEDDRVSRTQDRHPVAATDAPMKSEGATGSSSSDSTERSSRTSRVEEPPPAARDRRREAGKRGPDRRGHRAAEHAAAHEEPGSRRGRTKGNDR